MAPFFSKDYEMKIIQITDIHLTTEGKSILGRDPNLRHHVLQPAEYKHPEDDFSEAFQVQLAPFLQLIEVSAAK